MKKLLRIFKRRWFLSLLGVIAICLLIWFVGPLVAIANVKPLAPEMARTLAVLLVVLVWLATLVARHVRAVLANRAIVEAMVKSAGSGSGEDEAELAELRGKFKLAMEQMGADSRTRRYFHSLPIYMIIGPPAAGKTTALARSGLISPLDPRKSAEEIRGIGGTRNCDWWLTSKAMLLDTAGRYLTQDSHEAQDSREWESFLQLLKRQRAHQPLTGVIVAIGIEELVTQTEAQRRFHVARVRERIFELQRVFGYRLLVYVMFTKCDWLQGFVEYFADLVSPADRERVWGTTFDLATSKGGAEELLASFPGRYEELVRLLDDRLVDRLATERREDVRGLIYGFPREVRRLGERWIQPFLRELLQAPAMNDQLPVVRGVYLTSGTQTGETLLRLDDEMSRSLGLPPAAPEHQADRGRAYFIHDLLERVIFTEAPLADFDRGAVQIRTWTQRLAVSGAIAAVAIGAAAWFVSFQSNASYLRDVDFKLRDYEKEVETQSIKTSFEALLPRLDAMRKVAEDAGRYEPDGAPAGGDDAQDEADASTRPDGPPLSMRMWLYTGDLTSVEAKRAYARELQSRLLPLIVFRIHVYLTRARASGNDDRVLQYIALKLYVLLRDRTEERMAEHVELLREFIKDDLATQGLDGATRDKLELHVDALLATDLSQSEAARGLFDADLIKDTRQDLAALHLGDLLYQRAKWEARRLNAPPVRLSSEVEQVFERKTGRDVREPISPLYTSPGFVEFFLTRRGELVESARSELWVLNDEPSSIRRLQANELEERLTGAYVDDYIDIWRSRIADLQVERFDTIDGGRALLSQLVTRPPPIQQVLDALNDNTGLDRVGTLGRKLAREATGGRLRELMRGLVPDEPEEEEQAEPEPDNDAMRIAARFKDLNRMVREEGNQTAQVHETTRMMRELYEYLEVASSTGEPRPETIPQVLSRAQPLPVPVRDWLVSLARDSERVGRRIVVQTERADQAETRGDAIARMNSDWRSTVAPLCRTLSRRYPLDRESTEEASLDDFGKLFGPAGLIAGFFDEHLDGYVRASGEKWRWTERDGLSLNLPDSALETFRRAAVIKEAFFHEGGVRPAVNFKVKVTYLDTYMPTFRFEVDGQEVVYRHEPVRDKPVKWPGDEGAGSVRVEFQQFENQADRDTVSGDWALFRYLDDRAGVDVQRLDADRLAVTVKISDHEARFELKADSVNNPFSLSELADFECLPEFRS